MKKVEPMKFKDWINERGTGEVSKLLKCDVSAVRHWRRGHCLPGVHQMQKIRKYSGGAVSYEEMIETFLRIQKKKGQKE